MKVKNILLVSLFSLAVIACSSKGTGVDPINPPVDDNYVKDTWTLPDNGLLPIDAGNSLVSAPGNLDDRDSISSGKTYNLSQSLPNNFTYIMGNNKVDDNKATFYNASNGGGLKFQKTRYGFQSAAFDTYKYLNISFRVSAVENSSAAKKDESEAILHIYGYNQEGTPIVQKLIAQGSIDVSTKGKSLEVEIHNNEVCYFEMRMNANPYKGQQSYNFGIDQLIVKGHN